MYSVLSLSCMYESKGFWRFSMDTGTKEDESSTGHIWPTGFHHVTARSHLACVLKLMNFFLEGERRITETAYTESMGTGARLYTHDTQQCLPVFLAMVFALLPYILTHFKSALLAIILCAIIRNFSSSWFLLFDKRYELGRPVIPAGHY
jgi:hypothetical protein